MEIKKYYCNCCKKRKQPGVLIDLNLIMKSKTSKYFFEEKYSEENTREENLFYCGDLCPTCLVNVKNILKKFIDEKLMTLIPDDLEYIEWEREDEN